MMDSYCANFLTSQIAIIIYANVKNETGYRLHPDNFKLLRSCRTESNQYWR